MRSGHIKWHKWIEIMFLFWSLLLFKRLFLIIFSKIDNWGRTRCHRIGTRSWRRGGVFLRRWHNFSWLNSPRCNGLSSSCSNRGTFSDSSILGLEWPFMWQITKVYRYIWMNKFGTNIFSIATTSNYFWSSVVCKN